MNAFAFQEFVGSGQVLECMGLSSMDVKVAVTWSCHTCISMAPHGITGLTSSMCTTGDIMEYFHGGARLTLICQVHGCDHWVPQFVHLS